MLKHLLLLLLTVFTSGWGLAQADGVLIEGELRHKKTRDPLQNVTVTVMNGEEIVDSFEADGRYSYEVPHDGDYVLMFGAIDMVPQSVQVNASQVPEALHGELDALTWPVMLFDYVEGFDMSVVDAPFGIFDFDEDRESMELDRSHSSQMRGALDDEMERLGNQGREAERNQRYYEYAMEDAQKAERKGRWAAAKEEYEEALEFKPGDADAAAGLERANLALNPELADADGAADEEQRTRKSRQQRSPQPRNRNHSLRMCCPKFKIRRSERQPLLPQTTKMPMTSGCPLRKKRRRLRKSRTGVLMIRFVMRLPTIKAGHRCCPLLQCPFEPSRRKS